MLQSMYKIFIDVYIKFYTNFKVLLVTYVHISLSINSSDCADPNIQLSLLKKVQFFDYLLNTIIKVSLNYVLSQIKKLKTQPFCQQFTILMSLICSRDFMIIFFSVDNLQAAYIVVISECLRHLLQQQKNYSLQNIEKRFIRQTIYDTS